MSHSYLCPPHIYDSQMGIICPAEWTKQIIYNDSKTSSLKLYAPIGLRFKFDNCLVYENNP